MKSLSLFLVFFAFFLSFSHAYRTYYVGGKDGWVLEPKEKYNDWAGRQRFQVNDTLVFKYKKGSDSVLVVHKDDYFKCNGKNPVKKMTSGSSEFQFPNSGSFYFISGEEGHCQKGQKLITLVMAVRKGTPYVHPPPQAPPISPVPGKSPFPHPGPAHSPGPHGGGPVVKPPKSSPGPVLAPTPSSHHAPESGPTPSPSSHQAPNSGPSQSPGPYGPVANPPHTASPTPAPSTHHQSPTSGPSPSPIAQGPVANPPQSTPPSPSSPNMSPQPSTPSEAPTSSPPAPPQASPPGSTPTSPTNSPSSNQTSSQPPSPSKASATATATYSGLVVLATSVLCMVFGSLVG